MTDAVDEPRQRRPLPSRVSQDVVPEPEAAYFSRTPDADSASDNEREATELRSVTLVNRPVDVHGC
jgi:hypothetical protein